MLKVFISHSTYDIHIVNVLAKYLNANGIYAYIADRDRQIGKPISQKIRENINNSDFFLVLYTRNSKDSAYVNQEIGLWSNTIKANCIVPLVEKGIIPQGLLSGIEYIEYDPYNPNNSLNDAIDFLMRQSRNKEIREGIGIVTLVGIGVLALLGLSKLNDNNDVQ